MLERKIITTADGSKTIHLESWNEQYHSKHGAFQEANHVYINKGFLHRVNTFQGNTIEVLEIGFGTALNAMLTFTESIKQSLKINYTAYEAYPVQELELEALDYESKFSSNYVAFFKKMHTVSWNEFFEIAPHFFLNKQLKKFDQLEAANTYDLIFYDAFGPRVQPELWTEKLFQKMFNSLKNNGILVTYCAKGSVRRTMQAVGFNTERLPGPPGKREMLRATKKI
ncbi:MAG: tRNA (5-methylaminomethyl-2-thiouridine)(34)-methyltransferase MnmD [Flavobacteriaceae bacterium]